MAKALKGTPQANLPMPDGVIAVRINSDSGLHDDAGSLTEYFLAEFPPRARDDSLSPTGPPGKDIRDQLF